MNILANEIEIRFINNEDLDEGKDVLIELLEDNYKINFPNEKDLKEYAINSYKDMICFNEDKSAILIGAFKSNKIIGFLWAYKKKLFGENRIHIGHIIVSSNIRSKGIGTILIKSLEILAKEERIYVIELVTTLKNESTMNFYKSKGFDITRVQFEKKLGELDENR